MQEFLDFNRSTSKFRGVATAQSSSMPAAGDVPVGAEEEEPIDGTRNDTMVHAS